MRELRREQLIDDTDILLFDILNELKKLNKPIGLEKELDKHPYAVSHLVKYDCKYCGGEHDKSWEIGLCAKKNKKKVGVK